MMEEGEGWRVRRFHWAAGAHVRSSRPAGGALVDMGESMKRLAEVKDSLDIDVKQNFIDPLQAVAEKDIRDIQVLSSQMEPSRTVCVQLGNTVSPLRTSSTGKPG